MDFAPDPDRESVRQAVSQIAREFGHDYFRDRARRGESADELWKAIFGNGFGSVNLPEAHGGGGRGIQEMSLVCEELAAAGCPLLMMIVSPGICGSVIVRHGTESQKDRFLPDIADGRSKMSFAITEPDAGSNAHRISTTAVRDGANWVLRGQKYYITGVNEADNMLVVARTGGDEASRGKLSLFIVDTGAPGLSATPIPTEIVAPERQFTVIFDDVVVSADRLVGGVDGVGLTQVFAGLNPERINTAAQGIGLGRYFLDKSVSYARDRKVWDVPIGAHQGISHPLAAAKVSLELSSLMTAKAAWLYDTNQDAGEAANMAKYAAGEASMQCFEQAIQTHGGNGFSTEFGIADLWGLTRLLRSAPVSREMALNFVAQHSLGLPRSY